jgi:transcriptional regulator with GAF, ATPase, and Fis domain/predicted Zn-dependent protease
MELKAGDIVQRRYEIQRNLGRGGLATTYLARDRLWTGEVALKLLNASSSEHQQLLREEFGRLCGLSHPRLSRVHDLGTDHGPGGTLCFYTADFIDGVPLDEYARGRTWSAVSRALADAVTALTFLHGLSVRHGDFKPANVLVDQQGRGVLIDLGCAHPFGQLLEGEVSGTPAFLAPELYEGHGADGRADLFAVGVTLGLLLEQVAAPVEVQNLLSRLTTPRPQERTSTAEEVLEVLGGPDIAVASSVGAAPRLLGRRREMETFQSMLDRLLAGEPGPRGLWVHGASGVGRTRLLREMKWAAQQRCLAVEGRASGLCPVTFLLRLATGDESITDDLSGVLGACELFATSGSPTVLFFDDVQLLHQEDRLLLHALLRTVESTASLLVVCSSPEEATVSTANLESLFLAPLGMTEVQQWAQGTIPAHCGDRLLTVTGGFPADVETLLDQLSQKEFHEADLEALGSRLGGAELVVDGLDEQESYALALIVAVGGVLEEQDRQRHDLPDEVLRRLCHSGWLRRDGILWKVARRVDGRRIVAALPAQQVQRAHLDLVEQLRQQRKELGDEGRVEGSRLEARLAYHLLQAGKVAEASLALTEQGDLLRLDPPAWAPLANALAEVSKDPEVLLAAAEVDQLSGRAEDAKETLLSLGSREVDSALLVRLKAQLAACYIKLGQPRKAQHQLEGALELPTSADARAELADMLSRVLRQQGNYREAIVQAQAALGQSLDQSVEAALHEDIGVAASYLGDADLATRHLAEATDLQSGSPRQEYRIRTYGAIHAFRSGLLGEAIRGYRAALDVAQSHQLGDLIANAALNLGTALQQSGDWGAALESYERGLKVAVALGKSGTANTLRFNIANVQVQIGLFDRAEPMVQAVRRQAQASGVGYFEAATATVLGEIALFRGALDQAHEWFECARGTGGTQGTPREQAEVDLLLAELALRRGDQEQAATWLAAGRARAHESDAAAADLQARLLAGQGALELACGRGVEGLQLLEQARALAREAALGPLQAEVEANLAEAYGRQGAHSLADASRTTARQLWERIAASLPEALRDAFWGHPRRVGLGRQAAPESRHRFGADLRRFLEVNRRINSTLTVEAVLEYAMDAAIELTGAERGFVLIGRGETSTDDAFPSFEVPAARNIDRKHIGAPHHEFSRTIAVQVVQTGEPVVTTDAAQDERFQGQASIHAHRLRSVVCVPIRSPEGTLGALYLDHRGRRDQFEPEDLELLVAFGDQVALAVRNARLLSRLEHQTQELRARAEALEKANVRVEELLRGQEQEIDRLNEEVRARQQALEFRYDYSKIIFRGPAMRSVLATVDRVVDRSASVLVYGESGTGKELIARAIHFNGPRRDQRFVGVNCAALPETLLESELFGHVRGAFTGADQDREGLLAGASGGTLFLDELGEMPLSMQAKLLRVLQEREVTPLGASHAEPIDIRLVCATNRPLLDEVEDGRFRADLYYRVAVVEIRLPPLRERIEDIPLLARHILARLAGESGQPPPRLARDVVPALTRHPWPGNVRQLENVLTRAYVMASGNRLKASDLELHHVSTSQLAADREQFERDEARRILAALNANRWNVRAVSRALGIPSNTLYRKLKRYNIQRPAS